ncbi:insulinase family protein [Geodermatophilus sp. SYSU D01186]
MTGRPPDDAVVLPVLPPPGPLAALAVAVPLRALSPATQRLAPLLAALWADAAAGPDRLSDALVTLDLLGVQVDALPGGLRGAGGLATVPVPTGAALARVRPRCLAALQAADRSRGPGAGLLPAAVFGPTHRYGHPPADRQRAVATCTLDEVVAAAEEARTAAPVVAVAGLPPADWPGTPFRPGRHPAGPPPPPPAPHAVRVPVGGSRAVHLVGSPGLPLRDPRRAAVHVACALLSGHDGLLARELGSMAYSCAAFGREMADAGYLAALFECDPADVRRAAAAMDAALARLAGGVPAAAVQAAVDGLLVDHHRALRTARDRVVRACSYAVAGLDPAEVAAYPAQLAAVDAGAVARAVAGLGDPGSRVSLTLLPSAFPGISAGKDPGIP